VSGGEESRDGSMVNGQAARLATKRTLTEVPRSRVMSARVNFLFEVGSA
jgi:hypothetical protein